MSLWSRSSSLFVGALLATVLWSGCDLNPQPLPPGVTDNNGSATDAGSVTENPGAGNPSADASADSAPPPGSDDDDDDDRDAGAPVSDDAAAGDAAPDAAVTDAGDADAGDADAGDAGGDG